MVILVLGGFLLWVLLGQRGADRSDVTFRDAANPAVNGQGHEHPPSLVVRLGAVEGDGSSGRKYALKLGARGLPGPTN